MTTATDTENLGAALGRIPGGMFIAITQTGDQRVGMLASWVQQAGFEPPSLSLAVKPGREFHKAAQETGTFTLNILSKSNTELMKRFSHYQPDQFDNLAVESTHHGIILKDAVAYLNCKVTQWVDTGSDHHLAIAVIQSGNLLNPELEPMAHLRKSGFNY